MSFKLVWKVELLWTPTAIAYECCDVFGTELQAFLEFFSIDNTAKQAACLVRNFLP